jgi:hypothetical protein
MEEKFNEDSGMTVLAFIICSVQSMACPTLGIKC